MQSFGHSFRTIRKNKGYTLKHVASGIISISFLSKFERGDSDISLSTFIDLLDRIMITYEEFYSFHHSGKSNVIEAFFNRAEKAYIHRDLKTIEEMKMQALKSYQQTNHSPYHCNTLLLDVYKSIIQNEHFSVTNESLHVLTNYFFDIESWGYYELCLYNSTLFLLPTELVITFSNTVYSKKEMVKNIPFLHNVFIRILLNTVTYLTGGQDSEFAYEKECRTFLTFIENSDIPEQDLHARAALNQAKGYLLIRLGNIDKGIEIINRTISIYKELGAENLAFESSNYLQILLQKHTP